MAKRGPKPKPQNAAGAPSVVFSSRMAPELKAKLEEAAAESSTRLLRPVTLSEEIQTRLVQSFKLDDKIAEHFGDEQTYLMMRTIALAISWSGVGGIASRLSWLDDPAWFDQAVKTINRLLEVVRPEGDTSPNIKTSASKEDIEAVQQYMRDTVADAIWLDVKSADLSLPRHAGTSNDSLMRWVKSRVGHVAERSPATLDDVNKRAQEMRARKRK